MQKSLKNGSVNLAHINKTLRSISFGQDVSNFFEQ